MSDPMGITSCLVGVGKKRESRCPFGGDSSRVPYSNEDEENRDSSECPFMARITLSSFVPSLGLWSEQHTSPEQLKSYRIHGPEFIIESKYPPSPRFLSILEGLYEPGDSGNPAEPPPWLDRELFDRGRDFYRRHLNSICFSNLLSLMMMMSSKGGLNPLIYTDKSDTPIKALKRYFSTLMHVITWYRGDVWDPDDEAHRDIMSIRSVHTKIASLCNLPEENEKVKNIDVSDRGHKESASPIYPAINQDMSRHLQAKIIHVSQDQPWLYFNQADMSITQYAFMGILLAHPEKLGIGTVTKEELSGFIHFWRGIGWLLGVDDKYNFCGGSVEETTALCLEVERLIAVPSLAQAKWNYEHMAMSLVSGMGMVIKFLSFRMMFRYLAYTIDVPVPSLVKQMTYTECFHYWVTRLGFKLMQIFPKVAAIANYSFSKLIFRTHGKPNGKALGIGKCPIAFGKHFS